MATVTYKKGKLYDLPIIDLKQDPNQPRKSMDPQALEELVASIKTHGIIQPILFRVAADSSPLFIVAGERRYKAAQLAGLTGGKTGATPYFFSENRELYRLFRPTGQDLIIGSCPPFLYLEQKTQALISGFMV